LFNLLTYENFLYSRFSKDQDSMDNTLADAWRMFLGTLGMTLSTFGLMIYVFPYFAIPLVPLLVLYYYVQLFYRFTSRELKRLDSVSRSPLYAHFAESLNGLPTIRAYREQSRFAQVNQSHTDYNNRPYYQQICAQRWLSLRLETIGSLLFLTSGLLAVILVGQVSVSLIGLSLSYALSVTSVLNWCVRQAAETETQMNCVERLSHYAEKLETEAPAISDVRPDPSWPSKSEIAFSDVSMSYREGLPLVLKSVNLKFPGGSKVAITGRTGSGKSTLIVALFRLVEISGGKVEIDGVDISKLGLKDLRSRISCIPQDPVLFSGTIRTNLDRFNVVDDATLWECLERSGLKPHVESLEAKLDSPVSENGENFSVGQRQLCKFS
jgi:ATP-binding cassette subfamily C (CFTR/MRP) protein 1